MQRLEARLAALEARSVSTDRHLSRAKSATLSASIHALLVAVSPDGIDQLLTRLNVGIETDSDRAMLAGLPPCHLAPLELVRLVETVQHDV